MKMTAASTETFNQHLIDPVICIRCNTCEITCPVHAIIHDDRNYVVDPELCNGCNACISPCPTGSIDNWRRVNRLAAYSVREQLAWAELPVQDEVLVCTEVEADAPAKTVVAQISFNSRTPPWSAAQAYTNLYNVRAGSLTATVTGNLRVTQAGHENDTHHIVLDFGSTSFPVLEGQSVGVTPPGSDGAGRAHPARQYSVASARNGERPGYNNISLTVKRVLQDHNGNAVRGVGSNYLCDLTVGDQVQIIGPFGTSFLMPNHPGSNIVMICTGTGSAPMRAMTEWRRRVRASGKFEGGKLLLFFGARTPQELPYFGPLRNLPADLVDINLAFSREDGKPKTYVQDLMRERAADLAVLLKDPNTYIYVCGIKAMENGVLQALQDVAEGAGLRWGNLGAELQRSARLHLETY
ncbi:MAG: benzoyl-CoA 2,3-epoxidase subunit [Gammaproteobacteria bacterium]|jgi:benzoyl-CoA 2,3-dioxygenase component A|nr:benzoyl-CoA 2,3-epoxidase subunit [Gammaproteobacteria bacterium]